MSPRAACRLETLGFASVDDYVGGKEDWLAHELPTEGELAALVPPQAARPNNDAAPAAPAKKVRRLGASAGVNRTIVGVPSGSGREGGAAGRARVKHLTFGNACRYYTVGGLTPRGTLGSRIFCLVSASRIGG